MKRTNTGRRYAYILHQIFNERRSNCALLAELLVVSCVIWYLVDSAYVIVAKAMEPNGFDATNCYRLDITALDETSVGYDPAHPDTADIRANNFLALADRLQHDKDIEAVGYSWRNDPYQSSLQINRLEYDTLSTQARVVVCNPDFLKVFRYRGANGETPGQLAAMLKDHNMLLSKGAFGEDCNLNRIIGKEIKTGVNIDGTQNYRLAGVFMPAKRSSSEEIKSIRTYILPINIHALTGNVPNYLSLAVRVKENRAPGFADRMCKKMKGQKMRAGNIYLSAIHSYDDLKADSETEQDMEMRNYTVAIVFLLTNVFLGLLGTFWLRTQHRFPEIGLQKAIGATNTDITLRLLAEAILLMTIAFLPSLIIDFNIAHANLTEYYNEETLETGRFAVCAAISYVLMLAIIALGIWFPALRAARTKPVDVLRGE